MYLSYQTHAGCLTLCQYARRRWDQNACRFIRVLLGGTSVGGREQRWSEEKAGMWCSGNRRLNSANPSGARKLGWIFSAILSCGDGTRLLYPHGNQSLDAGCPGKRVWFWVRQCYHQGNSEGSSQLAAFLSLYHCYLEFFRHSQLNLILGQKAKTFSLRWPSESQSMRTKSMTATD